MPNSCDCTIACPLHAKAEALAGALAVLAQTHQHTAFCGCDHTQNDPDCEIGVARALLKELGR